MGDGKIYGFFKKIFGRRAENERRLALLEVNYEMLKDQYKDLEEFYKDLAKEYKCLKERCEDRDNKDLYYRGKQEEALAGILSEVKDLKTISARTTAQAQPITASQLLDEYFNGPTEVRNE